MSPRILVVEDEKDIADLLTLHLKREGHDVTSVEGGEEALRVLQQSPAYQLIILDWMLPGVTGLDICKKLRREADHPAANVPICLVTARAHSSDIILGLEMGADDYVTKPFELPVLLARVRALLRRASQVGLEQETLFRVGDLSVNSETYDVHCGKKDIQLTPSEFRLLVAMLRNRGRVLTRERLIDLVQGEGVNVVDRTIDTHIFGLRKKLGKCSDVVETIRGVGYRVKSE